MNHPRLSTNRYATGRRCFGHVRGAGRNQSTLYVETAAWERDMASEMRFAEDIGIGSRTAFRVAVGIFDM